MTAGRPPAPPAPGPAPGPAPSLREERALLRAGHHRVAGVDEVGRGALAGPVSVGVVVVTAATRSAPQGLRDSKLLTAEARGRLAPRLRRWATAWAVGHAEPEEVDDLGVLRALRLAGSRALALLEHRPDAVVLDGDYDWLQRPEAPAACAGLPGSVGPAPAVRPRVKADLRCAAVAAASVLAKVERDALMARRAVMHPAYGWERNKGYSAPEHLAALAEHGPCAQHRLSWRLPGCSGTGRGPGGAGAGGVLDLRTPVHDGHR